MRFLSVRTTLSEIIEEGTSLSGAEATQLLRQIESDKAMNDLYSKYEYGMGNFLLAEVRRIIDEQESKE